MTTLQPGQLVEPSEKHLGEFHREDYVREMLIDKVVPMGSTVFGTLLASTNLVTLVDKGGHPIVGIHGRQHFHEEWLRAKQQVAMPQA